MRRLLTGIVVLGFTGLAAITLSADSALLQPSPVPAKPAAAVSETSMEKASLELQAMLAAVSDLAPDTAWEQEQPVATIVKDASCSPPEDSAWKISWNGTTATSAEAFEDGLERLFTDEVYQVRSLNPQEFGILGESGFSAGIRFVPSSDRIETQFLSACFQEEPAAP